ncbi:MAG TPA: hypothetical protein VJZ71_15015 [Phycisphaerae bacterium]|nr:hypothetical protein [Phycisphaerae bacterium]
MIEAKSVHRIYILAYASYLALSSQLASVHADEIHIFRDPEERFSIGYTSNWRAIESSDSRTVLKLEFVDEDTWADFGIVVHFVSGLASMHPQEFARNGVDPKGVLADLKKAGLRAKILDSGQTTLCSQAAVFYESSVEHTSLNLKIPIQQLQVITIRQGFVFTLTFRTVPHEWQRFREEFEILAGGFRFTGPLVHNQVAGLDSGNEHIASRPNASSDEAEKLRMATPVVLMCVVLGAIIVLALVSSGRSKTSTAADIAILRNRKKKGRVAVQILMSLMVLNGLYLNGLPHGDLMTAIIPEFFGMFAGAFVISYLIVWVCYPPMRMRIPRVASGEVSKPDV